jgi:hypothetical protein
MNALWAYFWPPFGAALLAGGIAGTISFRRRARRNLALAAGLIVAIALAMLWHGPLGAADRLTARVERSARHLLDYYEMSEIRAHLHQGPLTRRLILTGPADDFQTSELARIMGEIPGVSSARWTEADPGPPLIAEGTAVAVLGFLLGLLLAYLVELRHRHNAQWNW